MDRKENNIEKSINHSEEGESDILIAEISTDIEKSISIPNISDDEKNRIISKALDPSPIESMKNDPSIKHLIDQMDEEDLLMYFPTYIVGWINNEANCSEAEYDEVYKLFVATLFSLINRVQREDGDEAASDIAGFVNELYFDDPDLSERIGKLTDKIELLSIIGRGSVARKNFYEHMEYEIFVGSEILPIENESMYQVFGEKDSIEAINLINIEYRVALLAIGYSKDSTSSSANVSRALKKLADNPETTPLVRLIAINRYQEIDNLINQTDNLDIQELYVNGVINGDEKYLVGVDDEFTDAQQSLHSQYPGFGKDELLMVIAPGVCVSVTKNQFDSIIDLSGRKANVSDWQPSNEFGISEDDMFLLKVAHEKEIKSQIESEIGVKLKDIPLETQIYFLRFAMEAGNERYDKLTKELSNYPEESDKLVLIEAFLALQFGDDFGDRLLHISEKLDNSEVLVIFRYINEIRQSAKGISEHFKGSIEEIEPALQIAWIKRITELLAVIADDETLDEGIKQAIDALGVLDYASKQINDSLNGDFRVESSEPGRTTYKSIDDILTITARISGSSSQRIGFKVSIPPGLTPSRPEIVKKEKLSIRFDHDDKYKLALDIGSSRSGEAPPGVNNISHFISEQMEKGEIAITGQKVYGNHVKEAFIGKLDELIKTDDDFAKVVNEFVAKLKIAQPLKIVPDGEKDAA